MTQEEMLKAYIDFFKKTVKDWIKTSDKYENRNKKRDFSTVRSSMSSFVRRYVGAEKFIETNEKLEKYLILNGYMIKSGKGYDISYPKYEEYKK